MFEDGFLRVVPDVCAILELLFSGTRGVDLLEEKKG